MGTAALCASVRLIRIQRAVGAIKTRQLSCFEWILVSQDPRRMSEHPAGVLLCQRCPVGRRCVSARRQSPVFAGERSRPPAARRRLSRPTPERDPRERPRASPSAVSRDLGNGGVPAAGQRSPFGEREMSVGPRGKGGIRSLCRRHPSEALREDRQGTGWLGKDRQRAFSRQPPRPAGRGFPQAELRGGAHPPLTGNTGSRPTAPPAR